MKNLHYRSPWQRRLSGESRTLFDFVEGFSNEELEYFVKILVGLTKCDEFIKLFSIFSNLKNDKEFILFLGLLSSSIIKVPSLKTLLVYKSYSCIYLYLCRNHFTEKAYEDASKIFNKEISDLQFIVLKIKEAIGNMETIVKEKNTVDMDKIDNIAELIKDLKNFQFYKGDNLDIYYNI
jgi:hypothetical protein